MRHRLEAFLRAGARRCGKTGAIWDAAVCEVAASLMRPLPSPRLSPEGERFFQKWNLDEARYDDSPARLLGDGRI